MFFAPVGGARRAPARPSASEIACPIQKSPNGRRDATRRTAFPGFAPATPEKAPERRGTQCLQIPSATTTHDAEDDPRNGDILIYVDGELTPRAEAKVSVYDSGFMLGDGMWEGMRLYNGTWAFFDEHMDRLFDSCKAVSLDIGMDRRGILDALTMTAEANGMTTDVHCRLMVTRGVKVKPFQHPSLSRSGPTMVIIMEHSKPKDALQSRGIRLATVPQVRGLPTSQDPKFNSHSKLNCVIACLQAEEGGGGTKRSCSTPMAS